MAYVDYFKYIQSEEWKFKSKAMMWFAGYRCQICNGGDNQLNTHHRTYDNLGNETPQDLTVLCKDCHKLYHKGDFNLERHELICSLFGIERMEKYCEVIKKYVTTLDTITSLKQGQVVNICGIVVSDKTNEQPMYFRLEDLFDGIEVEVSPQVVETSRELIDYGRMILVNGTINFKGKTRVIANRITNELTSYNAH